MNGTITLREKVTNFQQVLDSRMTAIAKSLPAHVMTPDRFARAVLSLVQRTPALLDTTPASLLGAVLQAAHLGLDVDQAMGQAYVIPYGKVAQLQIGYRGLLALAWRSGQLAKVAAEVVREGDIFEYELGINPILRHVPRAPLSAAVTHAYAIAKLRESQETMFNVLTKEQIEKVRSSSRSGKSGPWVSFWDEMAKKTALRRLSKLLPLSTEKDMPLRRAADLDERAELGLKQGLSLDDEEDPDDADEQALADGARIAEQKETK